MRSFDVIVSFYPDDKKWGVVINEWEGGEVKTLADLSLENMETCKATIDEVMSVLASETYDIIKERIEKIYAKIQRGKEGIKNDRNIKVC